METHISPLTSTGNPALWRKIDLWDLLKFCATAGGHFRYLATPQSAYFRDSLSQQWDSFKPHSKNFSSLNREYS